MAAVAAEGVVMVLIVGLLVTVVVVENLFGVLRVVVVESLVGLVVGVVVVVMENLFRVLRVVVVESFVGVVVGVVVEGLVTVLVVALKETIILMREIDELLPLRLIE